MFHYIRYGLQSQVLFLAFLRLPADFCSLISGPTIPERVTPCPPQAGHSQNCIPLHISKWPEPLQMPHSILNLAFSLHISKSGLQSQELF